MKTLTIIIIGEFLFMIVAILSDANIREIIIGIVAIISLLINVLVRNKMVIVQKEVVKVKDEVVVVKDELKSVGTQINGHMTKLLDLTEKGSRAEGKLEGKEEAKEEQVVIDKIKDIRL